jgi:hypothetical protein
MNDFYSIPDLNWSSWLDFDKNTINNIPIFEGVYKMHANMKILYIGNSNNIRQSLLELLLNSCVNKSATTRFSYAVTESSDKIKDFLLNEYRNKHNGKLPVCMES